MQKRWKKIVFIFSVMIFVFVFYKFDLGRYLTLSYIKENQLYFQNYYLSHPVDTLSLFFAIYVLSTALSLPGAAVLTLAAGALFGIVTGVVLVSFASSLGATIAFLSSRFILRDYIQNRFKKYVDSINQGVEKEGGLYLFTLRLIPLFPFFVVNLVMGLTSMSILKFFLISQLGMLAGTIVYVNAGLQVSQIESVSDLLSFKIIFSFTLLGVFPLLAKKVMDRIKMKSIYRKFKKPKKFDYNMVVIGGGSAGLVTSYISSAVKAKTLLIEKHKMGGDCLNTGCVPSKALIRSANIVHYMKNGERYGLQNLEVEVDLKKVMERVHHIIKAIEPHDSFERYQNLGVDTIEGEAKIISPFEVMVNDKRITTKNIIISTGARPFLPPIPGINEVNPLTSDNLWSLKTLPKKFMVLGGGPIGCEMAQCFRRLGSQVVQVEMMDRIMGIEDIEVSHFITERFKKEGIIVLTGHKAKEFKIIKGKKYLVAQFNGSEKEIEFDEILVAVGREANVRGFGLEELGIKLRANRTVEVNEYMQTNYPNIFACGDVTGPYQLTHTASHQAWYCAVNSLFGTFKKFKVDYSVIPWCTYTDPEMATVGLNEQMAKKKNISYDLTTYEINDLDRAIADSEDHGFIRVLTAPKSDKILGATIVGNHASDLMLEFISAMKNDFGLEKILGTIHIYPTMGEANKYLAGNWKKKQTPETILLWLKKFHQWSRS